MTGAAAPEAAMQPHRPLSNAQNGAERLWRDASGQPASSPGADETEDVAGRLLTYGTFALLQPSAFSTEDGQWSQWGKRRPSTALKRTALPSR